MRNLVAPLGVYIMHTTKSVLLEFAVSVSHTEEHERHAEF